MTQAPSEAATDAILSSWQIESECESAEEIRESIIRLIDEAYGTYEAGRKQSTIVSLCCIIKDYAKHAGQCTGDPCVCGLSPKLAEISKLKGTDDED